MGWWGGWYGDGGRERARPTRPAWPTFRRAMGLLWPHRLLVAGYLAAIGLSSLVGLGPPLLIGKITGAIVDQKSGEIDLVFVLLLAVIAISALIGVAQSYLNNRTAQIVMFDLRERLYRHLS